MYLCDIKLHTIIQLWNFAKRIYCAFRKALRNNLHYFYRMIFVYYWVRTIQMDRMWVGRSNRFCHYWVIASKMSQANEKKDRVSLWMDIKVKKVWN